jgi:Lrp/AsnC family leucine-responsive transcriptional regulator
VTDRTLQMARLDELDTAIIDALKADGRTSNQQLSRDLGVTSAAIGQRLRRLEREDVLRIVLVSDFALTGADLLLAVGIHVHGRSARSVAADLARLPQVFSASTMMGRYNVEALVALSGVDALRGFVEDELARIDGIAEINFDVAIDMLKYEFNVVPFVEGLAPTPMASPLLDTFDRDIIASLADDARKSNRTVADELGVTEGTVRARLKRLREEDLIRFTALTNSSKGERRNSVFIRIRAEISRLRAVAEAIADIPEARCVIVIAGTHNILVIGQFDENLSADAPINRIYALPGVLSIETSSIAESLKYNFRVAKIIPRAKPR